MGSVLLVPEHEFPVMLRATRNVTEETARGSLGNLGVNLEPNHKNNNISLMKFND